MSWNLINFNTTSSVYWDWALLIGLGAKSAITEENYELPMTAISLLRQLKASNAKLALLLWCQSPPNRDVNSTQNVLIALMMTQKIIGASLESYQVTTVVCQDISRPHILTAPLMSKSSKQRCKQHPWYKLNWWWQTRRLKFPTSDHLLATHVYLAVPLLLQNM